MTDNRAEIESIKRILNTGVRSSTVDGETTEFDLEALRRRLAELQAADSSVARKRRRRVRGIDLRNSF